MSDKKNKLLIAGVLQEIGALLQLKGDKFRARAYEKAADAIAELDRDLSTVIEQKGLTRIRGIGDSIAALIEELHQSGRSVLLEKLRSEMPSGIVNLSRVPGLTLSRIEKMSNSLGITSVEELKAALRAGKVRDLPGFGLKTEQALLEQITRYETRDEQLLLVDALRIGQKVISYLESSPEIEGLDLAGSIRRWKETVSTIKVTASSSSSDEALEHFLAYPLISEVLSKDKASATVRVIEGATVSFNVTSSESYPLLLHNETGSKRYLEKVQRVAEERGIDLLPTVKTSKKRTSFRVSNEQDFYRHLKMQYIPPELREDEGEIEAALAGQLAEDLISLEDIKGMIHCHTTYSDGRNSVEEMALAAEAMGMKYITITDHSPTAFYAGGLKPDQLKRQWDEIDRVQEKVSITLLKGTESDILREGDLDYPDDILEKFDVIIASIHNRYKLDEDQMTRRVINAMKNPLFKIWGHPLGRLVQRRPPIPCRLEEILDTIAESNAAIEISGDPHRLDLEPRWSREARKRQIKFVISTDAHSTGELRNIKFGIGLARRAGVRKGEVLNTLTPKQFLRAVKN